MEATPERPQRSEAVPFSIAADQNTSPRRSSRIKRPPPITPRRFNRFFTPRQANGPQIARVSRKALKDLSKAAFNTRQNNATPQRFSKRRKLSFHSPTFSVPSSPIRKAGFLSSSQEQPQDQDDEVAESALKEGFADSDASTDIDDVPGGGHSRTTLYAQAGTSASLLSSRTGGRRQRARISGKHMWLHETNSFYSSATDINRDLGPTNDSQTLGTPPMLPLPFCTVSCNTNPLLAVGDEAGHVRLVDSANETPASFAQTLLTMKPHDNAIMDLAFSEDDALLATASGDQTCHIIDVKSQKSVWSLAGHISSVKRIQFQPSTANMLSTCARDGSILIWDTRGDPADRPAHTVQTAIAEDVRALSPKCTIHDAHLALRTRPSGYTGRSDFSVTSLSFINPLRPHLFVTASESDSVVKLWDMRSIHRFRRKTVPISCTAEPRSHKVHRHFGITSLGMSTDHATLYTLCRDHTIYAYSASHLILGAAPELSNNSKPFQPVNKKAPDSKTGLGPLYGFRHPALQISTFYPKLAIRKATDTSCELIAVGSSDDCAVLFPTHPRYLTAAAREVPPRAPGPVRRLTRIDSQSASLGFIYRRALDRNSGSIPIYYHGTPLVRGHSKEVTGVAWSSEGNLVTISDDFATRCWREDAERARSLRINGEGAGARWGCGWADIGRERRQWDDDE